MKSLDSRKKRVMIFGVFDRLHEGHRDFLRQARARGDELVVVVARDRVVRILKGKSPHEDEETRRKRVSEDVHVSFAVLGDEIGGSYGVIAQYEPDIICVGYDQDMLAADLETRMRNGEIAAIPVIRLKPHEGEKFHSSLLNNRKDLS